MSFICNIINRPNIVLQVYNMEKQVLESSEERTFQYQDSLPPLPVPPLDESLSKYLDSGNDLTVEWCVYLEPG